MTSDTGQFQRAKAWLAAHGLRQTRARLGMAQFLLEAKSPVTLAELQQNAGQSCDFATVFRFVDALQKNNLVTTHSWGRRQMRYELAENQAGDHHHHHLICKVCQRVEPVDACAVSKLEKNIVAEYGYADVSHRLEFFGVCPQCQK